MDRRLTQREKILQYMVAYGAITPIDAMREFGCMRLATRIFELKQAGHNITTTIESAKNKFGDTVHYARYTLIKREDQNNAE